MPDLGKYALWVLSAYGVSITLLLAIVVLSVLQARRTLGELRRMEEGRAKPGVEPSGERANG